MGNVTSRLIYHLKPILFIVLIIHIVLDFIKFLYYIEASKEEWANPILSIIGLNSLRLGGLHIIPDIL